MFHFRSPGDAVAAAVEMVENVPAAGLPPAHAGVAAGPVVAQDGDYFGRTVNLASRLSEEAGAGQVLVTEALSRLETESVRFIEHEDLDLKGFAQPVKVFEARRG